MIVFASEDGHGAVELFHEDDSHHLVGECHFRQRQFFASHFVDTAAEAIWSTDDEYQAPAGRREFFLHPLSHFDATHFAATFVEQYHPVAILDERDDEFALPFADLVARERLSVLEIADGDNLQRQVVFEPLGIFFDDVGEGFDGGFTNLDEREFHDGCWLLAVSCWLLAVGANWANGTNGADWG